MAAIPTSSYALDDESRIVEGSTQDCNAKVETVQHPIQEQKSGIQRLEVQSAPIHRLIDDILLEIFICVVQDGIPIWMALDEPHPAVPLSRVSRRWRALALSSPGLWTELGVDLEDDPRCWYLRQSPESFLSLSRSLALDVHIYGHSCVTNPKSLHRFRMVAGALLQSVARWKNATIVLPWPADNPDLWRLLQCAPAAYTQLETLRISVHPESWTVVGQPQGFDAMAILHTPALRSLVLDTWNATWVIPSSWVQLRELRVSQRVDRAALNALISGCPNLSKLSATMDQSERIEGTPPTSEDRIHSSLKALSLLYYPSSPICLLHIPNTPALQILSVSHSVVRYRNNEEENDVVLHSHASILHIVQICSSSLVELTLFHCVFHDTALIRILHFLTNLEHLDLEGQPAALTSNLFLHLTPVPILQSCETRPSRAVVLCPNLVSLKLRVRGDDLSTADERIELAFSLIAGLIARGASAVHILSEVWSTVESKMDNWRSMMTDAALDEVSVRQSKKDEVKRRIGEMRDDLGIRGLRLERYDDWEWLRDDLVEDRYAGHGARFVGHIVVYESG